MKTLCMDTSHRYLVLVLIEDHEVKASYMKEAWKQQSETIFPELLNILSKAQWDIHELDRIVITAGPGSYTGLRITMTIAKVLCTQLHKDLYTVSTLLLYGGIEDTSVILDARSKRVYYGKVKHGKVLEECIKEIDALDLEENYVGDVGLIHQSKPIPDFVDHFLALEPYYEKVDHPHTLVPHYLKKASDYEVKKHDA